MFFFVELMIKLKIKLVLRVEVMGDVISKEFFVFIISFVGVLKIKELIVDDYSMSV